MNIDGIDPSQVENLKTPFLENSSNTPIQAPTPEQQQQVETAKIEQLAEQAQQLPDNRPDVVDRGRELLSDPNFPSPQVEEDVAKILLGFEDENF